MFRNLILSVVLLTNAFAQNAALNSSGFKGARELKTQSAFAQKVALETSGFDSAYKLSVPKPVQDKNFYLLSLFQRTDRKSTRLNSSHGYISYAVFCLKKKNKYRQALSIT